MTPPDQNQKTSDNLLGAQQVPYNASFFYRDYANKHNNPDSDSTRLSETRFVLPFNIKQMHTDQGGLFRSRNRLIKAIENPTLLADLLADVVATSKTDSVESADDRILASVDMYKGALREHGFSIEKWANLDGKIKSLASEECLVLWIVAGCQDRELVKRRGQAAAMAFCKVANALKDTKHEVVFCGAHPPMDRVDEHNEAALLEDSFLNTLKVKNADLAKEVSSASNKYHIIKENKSTTTKENIQLAFEQIVAKLIDPTTTHKQYGVCDKNIGRV